MLTVRETLRFSHILSVVNDVDTSSEASFNSRGALSNLDPQALKTLMSLTPEDMRLNGIAGISGRQAPPTRIYTASDSLEKLPQYDFLARAQAKRVRNYQTASSINIKGQELPLLWSPAKRLSHAQLESLKGE